MQPPSRPKTFGRALGIGVRFAGKALLANSPAKQGDGGAGHLSPEAAAAQQAAAQTAAQAKERERLARIHAAGKRGRAVGTDLAQGTRGVAHGTRNFGRAVWNPFAHATGVLWLEITGMFFALFAVFFAGHIVELRGSYRSGPEHQRFLLYVALTALFLYFSVTSFARARRKSRGRAARR